MKPINSLNIKIKNLHILILVASLILFLGALRWQVIDADKLGKVANERVSTSEINSTRGTIYSSDGTTLAYTEPKFNMFIWYEDLKYVEDNHLQTREEFLKKIAPIIDTTPELLDKKIKDTLDKGVEWIQIASSLSDSQWNTLTSLKTNYNDPLQGFQFQNVYKRIYPEGRLASHILGLTNVVNNKIVGLGGIEGGWDSILNPIKGYITQETNAKGQAISTALTATVEAKNGSSVFISINKKLQQIVQDQIKAGVEKYEAKSGSVVIMDPKTGEITALANYPDYDPNLRQETDVQVYSNNALTSPYEMGSIGKALTISAAIDLGRVTPYTVILPNGHKGCEVFTNELGALCTADHKPQPPMPLKDCFAISDNICLFHLAKEYLSKAEFHDYLIKFGIGTVSGIDVDPQSESIFTLRPLNQWSISDVAAMSFGHGYGVNEIQALEAIGAIANNGVRMQPHFVTKTVDSDGNVNVYKPQVINTVISPQTSQTLLSMMANNFATKGIAANEYFYNDLKNYNLGIKSGTALIADGSSYSNEINATFVGFDESPQRTFIMLIRLEKPQIPRGQNLSFYNVRPLWLDTFRAIKDVIAVPRKS